VACSFVLFCFVLFVPEYVLLESNVWKVSVTSGKMFVCLFVCIVLCVSVSVRGTGKKRINLKVFEKETELQNNEASTNKTVWAYFIRMCFVNRKTISHTSTEEQRH
jgi:hypothetical protein